MPKKTRVRRHARGVELMDGRLGRSEACRRLLRYMRPLLALIAGALILTGIYSAVDLGYGVTAKIFFDTIEKYKGSGQTWRITGVAIAAIAVYAIRGFLLFAMNYTWAYISNRLALRLRNDLFETIQRQSLSFFDRRKTGQLLASLSNDVPQATSVLDAIQDTFSAPLILIGGIGLLFYINTPLALVSCISLPPIAWIIVHTTRRIAGYTEELQNKRSKVLDLAQESLSSIRVVKSFGNEEYEILRFRRDSYNVARAVLRTIRVRMSMRPAVELLGTIAIVLVAWVGGYQVIQRAGALTFGDLVFFVMVLQKVAAAAKDVGGISLNFSTSAVAADRIFTLMDIRSETQEKPLAVELGEVRGRIVFDRVSFSYQPEVPVLRDLSFVMEPGEVVAVVGPTGAGKTTIASLVPRFYDVTGGAITIDGVDIRDCTLASLRRQIGIVPQDTILFATTLRENILYGRLDASEDEVIAAARAANAWEFIERLPDGLDTRVGERGVTLSGGQRQRIAIARAILRDPRILILDEATSSLDSHSEALVQEALQRLVAHRTTLVIAHRLSTIQNADKILVLKGGSIVEYGRHSELLHSGGLYAHLYRTQFRERGAELQECARG